MTALKVETIKLLYIGGKQCVKKLNAHFGLAAIVFRKHAKEATKIGKNNYYI